MNPAAINLDLDLKGTHVLITGGLGLIGQIVVEHFIAAGANVSSLDIGYPVTGSKEVKQGQDEATDPVMQTPLTIHCDISSEEGVEEAFRKARDVHGTIEVCIALASLDLSVLQHASITDGSFTQLKRVLDVNIAGTWLTAREFLRGLRVAREEGQTLRNVNLIIIGSESGHFGERLNADYSLGKSAVQTGLLMSLKQDVVREWPGARVNCVAPGPVQTARWEEECMQNPEQYYLEAQATTALCQPIPRQAVAKSILFLASDNFSSHVHGQVINVDGGKQGKVVWTKEEILVNAQTQH